MPGFTADELALLRGWLDIPPSAPACPSAAAAAGPSTEAEIARAGRLAEAQAMLAAGQPVTRAAAHAGIDKSGLAKTLDQNGHLVLTAEGQRLLDGPDPRLAAQFAALPRSLWPKDLLLLAQLLQYQAAGPVANLRAAAAQAGISPQALDHLFDDEGALRSDRFATLPQGQQDRLQLALEPGDSARRGSPEVQHARTLADAQALLVTGIPNQEAAALASMHSTTLSKVLDAHGHLLLVPHALRLLECPDPALAAHFAALPRALRLRDLRSLAELLRLHGSDAPADLRAAAIAKRMEHQAVAHLFDTDGRLRPDRLATLPDDQQQRLQAATQPLGARPAPAPRAAPKRPRPTPRPSPPAPTAQPTARIPGGAEAAAVLQFVRQHARPAHAFDDAHHATPVQAFTDAQAEFDLRPAALLQLLARAGVTEMEAQGGQIPSAAQLWQRMRDGVRGPAAAATPEAAERPPTRQRLDQAGPADERLAWGAQRPRTRVGRAPGPATTGDFEPGLPDPGIPPWDHLDFMGPGPFSDADFEMIGQALDDPDQSPGPANTSAAR